MSSNPSLGDVQHAVIRALVGTRNTNPGGLVRGSSAAAKIKYTAAINYHIDGIWATALAAAEYTLVTGGDAFAIQPDLTTCFYAISVDAAGNVFVVQGNFLLTSGIALLPPTVVNAASVVIYPLSGTVPGAGKLPNHKAGTCLLGYAKVVMSGGTFTPATTAFNGTGATSTFLECAIPPLADTF